MNDSPTIPRASRHAVVLSAACLVVFVLAPRLLLRSRISIVSSPDSPGYAAIAERLAAGDMLDPRLGQLRLPGYPLLLLAVERTVGLTTATLAWGQLLLGLIGAGCALLFLRRAGGADRSCLCAALVGLNPVFLMFEHWWMSETLFIFTCLALLMTVVLLGFAPARFSQGLAVGTAASAVLLTRANGAAFVAVCLGFVVLQYFWPAQEVAPHLQKPLTAAGIFGCAAALLIPLGVWTARNALVIGPPYYLAGGEQARLAYTVLLDVAGDADHTRRVLGSLYDPTDPASVYRVLADLRRAHPTRVEAAARDLRLALTAGRSAALWRARLRVFGAFFGVGSRDLPLRNVANTLSRGWIDPDPEFFLRAQRTEFWNRYGNHVPEGSLVAKLVGEAGLRYLQGGRFILYATYALVAFIALARHHNLTDLHVRVTVLLLLTALTTASLHAWTLAGLDRFSAAFDWIPILGLAHSVTSAPDSRKKRGEQ